MFLESALRLGVMSSTTSLKAQFDDARDLFILQHLVNAKCQGKKSDSGFKKDVWTEIARTFNIKFGVAYQRQQFQSRGQAVVTFFLS